jgi:hypothetical protein
VRGLAFKHIGRRLPITRLRKASRQRCVVRCHRAMLFSVALGFICAISAASMAW